MQAIRRNPKGLAFFTAVRRAKIKAKQLANESREDLAPRSVGDVLGFILCAIASILACYTLGVTVGLM
jgi:hypothetical protein